MKQPKLLALAALGAVLVVILGSGAYVYAVSPASIRNPQLEHAHFRTQVIASGEYVDFRQDTYQTAYYKGQCTAGIFESPIHFHDNMDQFAHLHWKGITGGQVLKYYGWSLIGEASDTLGYRLDTLPSIKKVDTHGHVLPEMPGNAKLWVYTGDKEDFNERFTDEFLQQDLETFFGTQSSIGQKRSFIEKLVPATYAHGGVNDGHALGESETEQEKLTRINNLLGDVVIFAQATQPTDDQIKERFTNLAPLSESVCGG